MEGQSQTNPAERSAGSTQDDREPLTTSTPPPNTMETESPLFSIDDLLGMCDAEAAQEIHGKRSVTTISPTKPPGEPPTMIRFGGPARYRGIY